MDTVRQAVEEADDVLRSLSLEERRELERSLNRPSAAQVACVVNTLKRARIEERAPIGQLMILESGFTQRWAQRLAAKLAAIGCVTSLSESLSWSDDNPPGYVVTEVIGGLTSRRLLGHAQHEL